MKISKKVTLLLLLTVGWMTQSCHQNGKDSPSMETVVKQGKPLSQLQQEFLDLRFGMFIHFNIPTFSEQDWPDPQMSPSEFNPRRLDCNQWAEVAVSANIQYACLTTKHHSGFCIWDTKTTDYNVMNSPLKRDVVREYADAFRKKGLKVGLYYSILDTHHDIRAGWIKKEHIQFIKDQLTELFTNYGEITMLIIDGWDAWWSRISYEDIPFEEIYNHIKTLQPNCLIAEHNAGKYPDSELFYTDIKQYEQNAGQYISKESNRLPAASGYPINDAWFWKESFPTDSVKSAETLVYDNLIPLNEAHCNFILNAAPNRDGLIDDNAVAEFKKIGELWQYPGKASKLEIYKTPITTRNLAKGRPMNSSWSFDTQISDFANDDDFTTAWVSYDTVEEPYIEVLLDGEVPVNAIGFVELDDVPYYYKAEESRIGNYVISYYSDGEWNTLKTEQQKDFVRIHDCLSEIKASKVKVTFYNCRKGLAISELLVY
ncbi:alpha-L-fucosidase [Bacteroides congonensis]